MIGKTEALTAWLTTIVFATFADGRLPAEQALFAWSVSGTVAGAVLAGLHMRAGGWLQRLARAGLCFVTGLILAPWAIAYLPKAEITPAWWHAFAASGAGAAVAWMLVDEAGPIVRAAIQDWRRRRWPQSGGES